MNWFGLKLPQISKKSLLEEINSLQKAEKSSLYFLYSEFLLRAKRNIDYQKVLNSGSILAIDGKGTQWVLWKTLSVSFLAKIYFFLRKLNPYFAWVFLPFLFVIQLFVNCISLAFFLIFRQDLSSLTENELILGRDFVYEIFEICEEKKWSVLIVGGDGNFQVKAKIQQKYPLLNLQFWGKNADSELMRDTLGHIDLSIANLYEKFPDLSECKELLRKNPVDMVLVCLGGQSGKQEVFIHDLVLDNNVNFRLATGLGAALDHLGSGAGQKKAPEWMIQSGLEWVYRLLTQPYRRKRVLDSIFSLIWWTTFWDFDVNRDVK